MRVSNLTVPTKPTLRTKLRKVARRGGVRQRLHQNFRFTRHLHLSNDLARIIHNAEARLLDRHIESSKIVHAALLLLMLEAASADLVSPSA
jgi:hypothetical protein